MSVGDESFYIKSFWEGDIEHDVYDFVMYGALAVGLTKNLTLQCDLPISRSGAESLDSICRIMRILNYRGTYVQPIHLTNIVDDPVPQETKPGVMCMSGGVDSTFGGLLMSKEKRYPYGMLIAGADYPSADAPGFVELKERVDKICDTYKMSLFTCLLYTSDAADE